MSVNQILTLFCIYMGKKKKRKYDYSSLYVSVNFYFLLGDQIFSRKTTLGKDLKDLQYNIFLFSYIQTQHLKRTNNYQEISKSYCQMASLCCFSTSLEFFEMTFIASKVDFCELLLLAMDCYHQIITVVQQTSILQEHNAAPCNSKLIRQQSPDGIKFNFVHYNRSEKYVISSMQLMNLCLYLLYDCTSLT